MRSLTPRTVLPEFAAWPLHENLIDSFICVSIVSSTERVLSFLARTEVEHLCFLGTE